MATDQFLPALPSTIRIPLSPSFPQLLPNPTISFPDIVLDIPLSSTLKIPDELLLPTLIRHGAHGIARDIPGKGEDTRSADLLLAAA